MSKVFLIFWFLFVSIYTCLVDVYAAPSTRDIQHESAVNMLLESNPGFEAGDAGKFTATGGTKTLDRTTPLIGNASMKWDASASGEYFQSADITIPKGLLGGNCEVSFTYQWDSGTAGQIQLQVLDGSDNVIVQTTDSSGSDPLAVTSSGNRGFKRLNFSCPTSGSLQFNLYSNANAAEITIDGLYLGSAQNVGMVSGLWPSYTLYASGGSGDVQVTLSSGGGALNSDGVDGVIIPYKTDNGDWRVRFNFEATVSSTTRTGIGFGITGITTAAYTQAISSANNITYEQVGITSPSSSTVSSFHVTASATLYRLSGDIVIISKPTWATRTADQQVYNLDTTAMAWSGYHSGGSWTNATTTMQLPTGNASVTLSETINNNFGAVTTVSDGTGAQPALQFTPKKTGVFKVCAQAPLESTVGAASAYSALKLDGTTEIGSADQIHQSSTYHFASNVTICGLMNLTSIKSYTVEWHIRTDSGGSARLGYGVLQKAIHWHIYPITQSLPMPTIMNSVVSPDSDGVRVASAYITNSGTPTVSSQDGDWISSITDAGAGSPNILIESGIFSAAPRCLCTITSTGSAYRCTSGLPTTSQVNVRTWGVSDNLADLNFFVYCIGKK